MMTRLITPLFTKCLKKGKCKTFDERNSVFVTL
jgi:hypothetical protein